MYAGKYQAYLANYLKCILILLSLLEYKIALAKVHYVWVYKDRVVTTRRRWPCCSKKKKTELYFMTKWPNYSQMTQVKHVISLQPATILFHHNNTRSLLLYLQNETPESAKITTSAVRKGKPTLYMCIFRYYIYIIVFIAISLFVMSIKSLESEKTIL